MKKQMELNWKLMSNVDNIIDQRNNLYELLNKIHEDLRRVESSEVKSELERILMETPSDFKTE